MTGKTVDVIVASEAVRRPAKARTNKMAQNLGPFGACLKLERSIGILREAPKVIVGVVASCLDMMVTKRFGALPDEHQGFYYNRKREAMTSPTIIIFWGSPLLFLGYNLGRHVHLSGLSGELGGFRQISAATPTEAGRFGRPYEAVEPQFIGAHSGQNELHEKLGMYKSYPRRL